MKIKLLLLSFLLTCVLGSTRDAFVKRWDLDALTLRACRSECEDNTCEHRGREVVGSDQVLVVLGSDQVLGCMNACYMRHIGVSENECLGHCDRHGQSGCDLIVNDVIFSLCWARNVRGRACTSHIRPSECELGCRSYPEQIGNQCIKHADDPQSIEIGSCCGLPGEISCAPGFVLQAPVPDVCGGSCPENWCNHHGVLANARDFSCVPEQTGPSLHEQLKMKVKAAFDDVISSEKKNALPGLIRKAFHDAGHFDKTNGEVRMGCIQHFLSGNNKCTQHGNLEEAEIVVKAVMDKVTPEMVLSMADAVQLLGALAVDELAKGTGAASLYDRVRTGRVDPTAETCIKKDDMCKNLPDFSTKSHSTDHESIMDSLEDVFTSEIRGKMIRVNNLSKRDAVALIGAHTVGRHFTFGHWTQQPFIFDNEYFVQLKRVKDWIDQGNTFGQGEEAERPFGKTVFPTWFMDTKLVEDPDAPLGSLKFPNIMMLDADVTLVLNAPNLVEKYATNGARWRRDFDDAYVKMSELGFVSLDPPLDGENRRLLQQSEELLDEDFEFFQNLRILQQEQMKKIHGAFSKKF